MANNDIQIGEFISLTSAGMNTASFVQIRDALIKRYKDVYGNDIDLSTGNADGVFVNDIALIINNILQTMQNLYENLSVNTASGAFLDRLCALANVTRKGETASTASLILTNETENDITLQSNTIFVDTNGTEWVYEGDNIIIPHKVTNQPVVEISIVVKCTELGPIEAKAGSINQTLELDYINVNQPNDAIVGQSVESDSDLRARRAQSNGANGTTVLESLAGALLNLAGIRDVLIYNNNTSFNTSDVGYSGKKPKDNTTILAHSVYIIIRQEPNLNIEDSVIGQLIYEKMTPGILTTESNDSDATTHKNYNYIPKFQGTPYQDLQTIVYWKKCKPVHPEIKIVLNTFNNFTESEVNTIGKNMFDYLNTLPLSTDLTAQRLLIEASYADPQFLGNPTYNVQSVTVNNTTSYTNADTYYYYSNVAYDNSTKTITLS